MTKIEALLLIADMNLAQAIQNAEWMKASEAIENTAKEIAEWRKGR